MPKKAWNISNFSEGMNLKRTSKDIDPKGFEYATGYMALNDGSVSTKGVFDDIPSLEYGVGAFQANYSFQGTPNLYKVFPEIGFRRFGRAIYISSSASWKEEVTAPAAGGTIITGPHGLDVGTQITVLRSDTDMSYRTSSDLEKQIVFVSEIVSSSEFKLTGFSPGPSDQDEIFYAINADYVGNTFSRSTPTRGLQKNKFLLRAANQGKFGFFNIGINKYWFGKADESATNAFGNNPWYFDTKYLWDTNQHSRWANDETRISDTKVLDALYEDGVFRVMLDTPTQYFGGRLKRPVGLYSLEQEKRIFGGVRYWPGWYPLRQHCLAPHEYHRRRETIIGLDVSDMPDLRNIEFWRGAGTYGIDTAATSISSFITGASSPTGPTYPNESAIGSIRGQIHLEVGHGGSSGGTYGDWQFAANEKHEWIKVGMSFLYDDIEDEFASESNISIITSSTGDEWIGPLSTDSPGSDLALRLYWQFYEGSNEFMENQQFMANDASNVATSVRVECVPEFRGSGMNDGFSNDKCWNPRIVGARLYLMGDYSGAPDDSLGAGGDYNNFEDPLYLATINFASNDTTSMLKSKRSHSHDGFEATLWTSAGNDIYGQMIEIPGVPVLTYQLMTTYAHDENLHAWYKTSAIVNRKLYAGNVGYFKRLAPTSNGLEIRKEYPEVYPDRILFSPINKFDILPESNYLDLVRHDGQDIVKLIGFKTDLLVFKHEDMYIIDCSGEFEMLKETNYGLGIQNSMQVVNTPNAIYWVNSVGIFGYDGENKITNIISDRIEFSKWSNEIYNDKTYLTYEPQTKMLIVFSRYQGDNYYGDSNASCMFMISTQTGAVFFKDEITLGSINTIPSGCVNAENFIYTATSAPALTESEYSVIHNTTPNIAPSKFFGRWLLEISAYQDYDFQFGGNTLVRLLARYQNTGTEANNWVVVNSVDFAAGQANPTINNNQDMVQLINNQMNQLEYQLNENSPTTATWDWEVQGYIAESPSSGYNNSAIAKVTYAITATAKTEGTAGNLNDTDSASKLQALNTDNEVLGTTGMAFSSDTTVGNIRVASAQLFTFQQSHLVPGAAHTAGVWKIWINRNGRTQPGTEYKYSISFSQQELSAENSIITGSFSYVTAINHQYSTGTFVNDCRTIGDYVSGGAGAKVTNAYNSGNSTENLRQLIIYQINNQVTMGEIGFIIPDYFTVGSLTADTDGSVTGLTAEDHEDGGTHKYQYFTLTVINQSGGFQHLNVDMQYINSADGGGKLWRFNPSTKLKGSNQLITKDIDFGMPNVRKKVYRAYINYKTDSTPTNNLVVQYMVNGDGTWVDAVLKNSSGTTVTALPASTEWTKGTIENSTSLSTNSIYSIKYKISGEAFVEIDDISVIYRDKPPK